MARVSLTHSPPLEGRGGGSHGGSHILPLLRAPAVGCASLAWLVCEVRPWVTGASLLSSSGWVGIQPGAGWGVTSSLGTVGPACQSLLLAEFWPEG